MAGEDERRIETWTLALPDVLTPVGGNNAIPEGRGDHALVTGIGPETVTATTESAKIGVHICSASAQFQNMVNVGIPEPKRVCRLILAMGALTALLVP